MMRLSLPMALALAALSAALFFPAPVHAYNGRLQVKCDVPAKVYLNDVQVGKTGEVISGLPFGKCKMAVVAEGYRKHEQIIQILGNDVVVIDVKLGPDNGESPGPDGEKPENKESKEEDPDEDKPDIDIADMDEVRKASKAGDNERLREILKSGSEYLVKIAAAAALIRLKSTASIDFIDGEIGSKFKDAPVEWFNSSLLYRSFAFSRMLADDLTIAVAIEDKEIKFNSFESVVAGYVAILELKERRERFRKEVKDLQKKMSMLKRKKPDLWFGRYVRCKHNIKIRAKSIKDASALTSCLLSILKKASRSKADKDVKALAKYFHSQ